MQDEDQKADDFFADLIAAVEQQLASPETRYVQKTYLRLIEAGLSEESAKEEIAACLAAETDTMYRRKKEFDAQAYRASLEMIKPEG